MNKNEKLDWSKEFYQELSKAKVAIFADYKGLKAGEADDFRRRARTSNVQIRVLKNNLARLGTKDAASDVKTLIDGVTGPTLVAFGYGDPAAAAKAVLQFSKDHEALKLKPSLLGTKAMSVAEVEALANLPSREALLGTLLGVMNGPIRSFVTVLAAVPRGLVTVLAAIEKKKGGQS